MNLLKSNYFFYAIILTVKALFSHYLIFEQISIVTVIIEFLSLLLLFSVFELISHRKKTALYLVTDAIISSLFLAIVLYHQYYGAILTYKALQEVDQVGELGSSIFDMIQPVHMLFFADIPIILILLLLKKYPFSSLKLERKNTFLIAAASLSLIVGYLLTQNIGNIINEKKLAKKTGFMVYENYVFLNDTFGNKNKTEAAGELTVEKIYSIKGIDINKKSRLHGIAGNKNTIVVQLESLQNFPVGKKVNNVEITPALNNLMKESFYFSNFFQQIGKGNTSDAEFMTNTSFYPVGNEAMSEAYGDRDIPSLPKILKNLGYTSVTMHANDVEFWNRDKMYKALGFDNFYDKKFFGKQDQIAFGASDEILYKKSLNILENLDKQGKRFYANIISLSNHHPFKLPANKVRLQLPQEYVNTNLGNYLQSVNYADYALGQFIKDLKDKGLWNDTLLVIYGDHVGFQVDSEKDKTLFKKLFGRDYHTWLDGFNIPLVISMPWMESSGIESRTVGGQIDIMPTMASLLGISMDDHIHFGQDLFSHSKNVLGNRFYLPTGSFLNEDILFVPGEEFEDGNATLINTHQPVVDFNKYNKDFKRVLKLMELSDQYMKGLPKIKE